MSKIDKLIQRLRSNPSDFTFDEAKTILTHYGFEESNKGKTSGSRTEFTNGDQSYVLHKPHPNSELKKYQVRQLNEFLKEVGIIKD